MELALYFHSLHVIYVPQVPQFVRGYSLISLADTIPNKRGPTFPLDAAKISSSHGRKCRGMLLRGSPSNSSKGEAVGEHRGNPNTSEECVEERKDFECAAPIIISTSSKVP